MKQILYTPLLMWILLLCGCEETVECHWCKEDVKKGAKICKHCGKHPYGTGLATQTQVVHSLEERSGSGKWPPWKYVIAAIPVLIAVIGGATGGWQPSEWLWIAVVEVLLVWWMW